MRTGYFFYCLLVLMVFACNKEYSPKPDQSGLFMKFFGGFDTDKAYMASPTPDGGFICIGTTSSFGKGGTDMLVIKTDANGNKQWEKTFGGGKDDEGKSLQVLPDGSCFLLGDLSNTESITDLYLIRIDKEGNELWARPYGLPYRIERGNKLSLTRQGDILLIGNSFSGEGASDVLIIKVNPTGEIMFEQSYGLTGLKDDLGKVQETKSGNLIWCGSEYRNKDGHVAGTADLRVVLTRPEGEVIWDKNFGKTNSEIGADIALTDGGYIVVGTTYSTDNGNGNIYLVKLFDDGTMRWSKELKSNEWQRHDIGESVFQTSDGGYIITGSTESTGEGKKDIFLLKTDSNGEEEWYKTFGGKLDDTGNTVQQTSEGGYLIMGTVTAETNLMMCLIRTNSKGELVSR